MFASGPFAVAYLSGPTILAALSLSRYSPYFTVIRIAVAGSIFSSVLLSLSISCFSYSVVVSDGQSNSPAQTDDRLSWALDSASCQFNLLGRASAALGLAESLTPSALPDWLSHYG